MGQSSRSLPLSLTRSNQPSARSSSPAARYAEASENQRGTCGGMLSRGGNPRGGLGRSGERLGGGDRILLRQSHLAPKLLVAPALAPAGKEHRPSPELLGGGLGVRIPTGARLGERQIVERRPILALEAPVAQGFLAAAPVGKPFSRRTWAARFRAEATTAAGERDERATSSSRARAASRLSPVEPGHRLALQSAGPGRVFLRFAPGGRPRLPEKIDRPLLRLQIEARRPERLRLPECRGRFFQPLPAHEVKGEVAVAGPVVRAAA